MPLPPLGPVVVGPSGYSSAMNEAQTYSSFWYGNGANYILAIADASRTPHYFPLVPLRTPDYGRTWQVMTPMPSAWAIDWSGNQAGGFSCAFDGIDTLYVSFISKTNNIWLVSYVLSTDTWAIVDNTGPSISFPLTFTSYIQYLFIFPNGTICVIFSVTGFHLHHTQICHAFFYAGGSWSDESLLDGILPAYNIPANGGVQITVGFLGTSLIAGFWYWDSTYTVNVSFVTVNQDQSFSITNFGAISDQGMSVATWSAFIIGSILFVQYLADDGNHIGYVSFNGVTFTVLSPFFTGSVGPIDTGDGTTIYEAYNSPSLALNSTQNGTSFTPQESFSGSGNPIFIPFLGYFIENPGSPSTFSLYPVIPIPPPAPPTGIKLPFFGYVSLPNPATVCGPPVRLRPEFQKTKC